MKSILATVLLRDDAGNQLSRFTSTIDLSGENHVAAARQGISQAAAEVLSDYAAKHRDAVEAELAAIPAEEAKATEAKRLSDELQTTFDAYAVERMALDRKYPGVRSKRRQIKRILEEVREADRKRVLKDDP